ncbi:Hypothetical protein GLP15_2143 [Giardia lamblia P15]|uniref:Uncharacterized protein n=1 Tax=Giardia intestinalis (strain P15) TaxID=658858 RepID=E1F701_GIAIA|nr:Hypothetical protein GLP15_2143 [Giardia lamblia P15]
MKDQEVMDGWFDAATAGNTEYLEENIDLLGGSTTETGCSGLIRAIYAHKLASVEVLAAREYKIPDVSNKYPIEIALKLYYYDACFILLMLHPDKSFETRVKKLKEQYDSETITKKELNKRLGELTDEFVIGIRDCTLSPGYVSRISSVASEDVLLTLEEQSVQSFPPDDMGNDFMKEEAGKQKTLEDFKGTGEQDIDKQDVNDKKNFSEEKSTSSGEEKEEKKLVDSEHSIESSDEEASKKSETTPRPKKGCCRCM